MLLHFQKANMGNFEELRDRIANLVAQQEGLRNAFYSLFRDKLVETYPALNNLLSYHPQTEMAVKHEVTFLSLGEKVREVGGGVGSEVEMLQREGVDAVATTISYVFWHITSPRRWFEGKLETFFTLLWKVEIGKGTEQINVQLHFGTARVDDVAIIKDDKKLPTGLLPESIRGKYVFSCRLFPTVQYDAISSMAETRQLLGEYLRSLFIEKEIFWAWGLLCDKWLKAQMERLSMDTHVGGLLGKEVGWEWFSDPVEEKPRIVISPYPQPTGAPLESYRVAVRAVDGEDSATFQYKYRVVMPKREDGWEELFRINFWVTMRDEWLTAEVFLGGEEHNSRFPYHEVFKNSLPISGGRLPAVDEVFPPFLFDESNKDSILNHLLDYLFVLLPRRWGEELRLKVRGDMNGDAVHNILRTVGAKLVDAFCRKLIGSIEGNFPSIQLDVRKVFYQPKGATLTVTESGKSSAVKTLSIVLNFKLKWITLSVVGDIWMQVGYTPVSLSYLDDVGVKLQLIFTLHKTDFSINSCKVVASCKNVYSILAKRHGWDNFWNIVARIFRPIVGDCRVLEVKGEANVFLHEVLPTDWLTKFLEFVFAPSENTSVEHEVVVGWVVEKLINILPLTYELREG